MRCFELQALGKGCQQLASRVFTRCETVPPQIATGQMLGCRKHVTACHAEAKGWAPSSRL